MASSTGRSCCAPVHLSIAEPLVPGLTAAPAFSPTDTRPLTRRAKLLVGVQPLISLLTVGLVAARAVNVLS